MFSQCTSPTASFVPAKPGRFGNPDAVYRSETKLDPRIARGFETMGMMDSVAGLPLDAKAPLETLSASIAGFEQMMTGFLEEKYSKLPPIEGLTERTETIKGCEGDDLELRIYTPSQGGVSPFPGVLFLHGGGMMMGSISTPNIARWARVLASRGVVVVAVNFRNSAGLLGPHPFPAGLNDCASGFDWVHANRSELNIGGIVVQGDSGGGNLALALALKLKRDGKAAHCQGVYAICPMTYGDYLNAATENPELVSLYENGNYSPGNVESLSINARLYTPDPKVAKLTDPRAYPFHASREDLTGLPPVCISVNELDPLRDEGIGMYRKLAAAGNDCAAKTVLGATHCDDTSDDNGALARATVRDVAAFAREVCA